MIYEYYRIWICDVPVISLLKKGQLPAAWKSGVLSIISIYSKTSLKTVSLK